MYDELYSDVDELTETFDGLDTEAKRNVLQADDEFRLAAPENEDSDEDSLGEQTTNLELEIEIELVETVAEVMERLDKGPVSFNNLSSGSENFKKKWS